MLNGLERVGKADTRWESEDQRENDKSKHVTHGEVSTKASRQSTLGYIHGSSLSVDGAQATNLMVTQDTDKVFIQVWPPCGRNTYVLRLIVLLWIVLS